MNIKQTIEKAIEGGMISKHKLTSANKYWVTFEDFNGYIYNISIETFLLDPKFWKCLGKGMGWGMEKYNGTNECKHWVSYWHKFIDHLADGGSVESYFEKL